MFQAVTVMGYLGADPEMRYTANGTAVATFRLATSRVYNRDGERQEETTWFSVVCWQRTAEIAAQYLQKGRPALVEGRIATRTWEKPDGSKGYAWELVADRLVLIPDGSNKREYGGAGQYDRPASGGHVVAAAVQGGAVPMADFEGDIDPDDLPF